MVGKMDTAAGLMARAREATSLDNYGEDSFREGLERLVTALDREARLTDAGSIAQMQQIVHFLSQRLQVEDWYGRHPKIDAEEIVAPLIGLGLPRTGSTAMGFLLAQDPDVRSLRSWESVSPCPPPETATSESDPRIEITRRSLNARNARFPKMKAMYPSDPTGPVECQPLQGMDFKSQLFQAQAHVPGYANWLNYEADLVPTYRFVKRALKLLQWRCPGRRWQLKNPSNIVFIAALDAVFPDARFWMTHRDVAKVIPSSANLYCELARAFSDDVDPLYAGQLNAEVWELGMRRLIAFRDAGNEHRFIDIHFAPFQRDPLAEIKRLYAFIGEELTPEAHERMERWRTETPREQNEGHSYGAADFGLDKRLLRERFSFYNERFGVLTPAGTEDR